MSTVETVETSRTSPRESHHQAPVTMNANTQNAQRQSMATSGSALKQRQLVRKTPRFELDFMNMRVRLKFLVQTQLHSQLAQLSNNLSDTENLLRMTSVQAECMRGLGSWHGGL